MNNFDVNLNLYRNFYYVAKYGGFTKASNYAMISQSSLSSSIKNLESILDKKLFIRENNGIKLTNEGKKLYSKLEEIVYILNETTKKNELNIGCLRFIADNYLCSAVGKYKEKTKNIRININLDNATELYQKLKKDELDIVISRYPLFYRFENSVAVEKILDVENVFVCSKKYYEEEKEKMKNEGYIYSLILPDSSEKRRKIEQYLIDQDINYEISIELPNSNLLRKLILNNQGIGYVNKDYFKKEIENNEIIIIDTFKNIPSDNVAVIYNTKNNNDTIKDFVNVLKTTIKDFNS